MRTPSAAIIMRLAGALAAAIAIALAAAAGAHAGEVVVNGTFETGSFTGWTHGAGNTSGNYNPTWADHLVALDCPYAGSWSALLGFKYTNPRANRFGYMYQDVAIPTNISRATLSFKFRQQGYDGLQYDPFRMQIRNTANTILATVITFAFSEWNNNFKDSGWLDDDNAAPVGYDMTSYAGSTVRLYFRQDNLGDNLYETWAFVDNVSLVYRKFVDLAVDGDGDDRFGSLGSGAGGSSVRSAEAGETVVYLLDIENEGLDGDAYSISVTPPAGWTVTVSYGGVDRPLPWTTPPLAAGAKIQAEVRVTPPAGAALGGYRTVVNAVSTTRANRYDSAELWTNVVPADFLADLVIDSNGYGVIDPAGGGGISYREADPSTQVSYDVDLVNGGTLPDSFMIRFVPQPPLAAVMLDGGTTRTGAFRTGLIDPAGSRRYTLRVTVPASLVGGDYTNYVYVKSLTDTLRKDGVRAVTRVRAPKVDAIICGSGDDVYDATGAGGGGSSTIAGRRATTVYFPLIIQNEGGVADSFAVAWTAPGNGWTAFILDGGTNRALPWTTPRFAAFSERSYILGINIPNNAAYETYVSILSATSAVNGNVRESVTAAVTVASGNEVDLMIDGSGSNAYGPLGTGLGGSAIQTASPGDTVFFAVTVENEAGENLFDLAWNTPAGWRVSIGDSLATLRRVTAGAYTLEVRIPESCPGGIFDVIVDGVKTNKKFFVDSVRGRVIVTPPHIVDALIDGNGDEIFGAPGTGSGGSSSQSTIGGRTIRYTVELQNQGGDAESYAVSWNAMLGWTAVLDGSASPCTTAVVPAGNALLLAFDVTIPVSAAEADYDFTIDVRSILDPLNVESVRARVHVNPPPRADLIVNGDGANRTAPAGSGEGGRGIVFGSPGATATGTLVLVNRGGFPDSFRVSWGEPEGWPAGSVLLADSAGDHSSPLVTAVVDPGDSLVFTVKVSIPAGAALRSRFVVDAEALSRDLEDSGLFEVSTAAFVAGFVFDDADHDGARDAGEAGWPGVGLALSDPGGPLSAVSGGAGEYLYEIAAGLSRTLVELMPSGMISLSPDTVALAASAPGETLRVDFADVRASAVAPAHDVGGAAGSFADLAHTVTAGTAGQASLSAELPAGWIAIIYFDADANGVFGPGDSLLAPSRLDLDPAAPGRDIVPVIVRVFIPPQAGPGTSAAVTLTLAQTLRGTGLSVERSVVDHVLVLASSSGLLRLVKAVDRAAACPGDTLVYEIAFSNPGVEAIREIEIVDPIATSVDIVTGAFGIGRDIEWTHDGVTEYLTADPLDADEALFDSSEGRLRFVLSRRAPFELASGEQGRLVYRVRIR